MKIHVNISRMVSSWLFYKRHLLPAPKPCPWLKPWNPPPPGPPAEPKESYCRRLPSSLSICHVEKVVLQLHVYTLIIRDLKW